MSAGTGSITLTVGQKLKVPTGVANYLYLYEADGLIEVQLFKNNKVIETHNVSRLTNLPGKDFDLIQIKNLHNDENTIRAFYGTGDYDPPADRTEVTVNDTTPIKVNVADGEFYIDAVIAPPDEFEALADIAVTNSATLVSSAGANKKYTYIEVPEDADAPIRVGDSSVTTSKGLKIHPGQTAEFYNAGALYAIRTGASNVTISRMNGNKAV